LLARGACGATTTCTATPTITRTVTSNASFTALAYPGGVEIDR
jgi:hypothetical protein